MSIPDFQSLMLPLLQVAGDGVVHTSVEYRHALADVFQLTNDELSELLPSGTQPVFNNRVAWAMVYLYRAGLLARPKRGQYLITTRGREVLASNPTAINIAFLKQFPEFNEFHAKPAERKGADAIPLSDTPEEQLLASYEQLRAELSVELLDQVKSISPQFFERLVVELLVNMGYGGSMLDAGMAIGKSGDEGIDGTIKEDRLGLDVIYIQAKRWAGTVGRPEVQKFVGALHGKHARKGVFLTTGTFAQGAVEYAAAIDPKVVLIDGKRLTELMIDFNVGVTTRHTYHVKRIDTDYFSED
ncbi:MAG: restriction endonuclease [Bacteroidota bacterium]|jgi:restriction system protein|nr:restriction endonuclease [Bacteroidota bacterium]